MASEYERRAWANLGPALGQAFQGWGQQRARRAEFDAQMAMAELQRRDAKEAQQEQAANNRRILEMNEERAALELKRYEEDVEEEEELRDILGGFAIGAPDIPAAGRIAGEELGGRIQGAEGGLEKIRAAVAGLAPSLAKGAAEAPRTPYKTPTEYVQKAGLSREQAGLLTGALGVEAFMPPSGEELRANLGVALQTGVVTPGLEPWADVIAEQSEYTRLIQQYGLEGTKIDLEMKGKQNALLTMQIEQTGPFKRRPAGTGTKKKEYESPLDKLGMTPTDAFDFIFAEKEDWKQLKGEAEPTYDTFGDPIVDAKGNPVMKHDTKWAKVGTGEYVNDSPLAKQIRDHYLGDIEPDQNALVLEAAAIGMTPEEIAESAGMSLEDVQAILGTTETE